MRKIISLRSTVIMGAAVAAGSVAGSATEALVHLGHAAPVVTGAVTLWFAEKLDRLIGDDADAG